MKIVDALKSNIVMVPIVASVVVGTFTGVKYIVRLTDTVERNAGYIVKLQVREHSYDIKDLNR